MDKEIFNYWFYYKDGALYNRRNRAKAKAHTIAGTAKNNGIHVSLNGTKFLAHRIIWLLYNDDLPPHIYHIDGNNLNNQLSNLIGSIKITGEITKEKLDELFYYKDGKLYNRISRGSRAVAGSEAGSEDAQGYMQVCINKKVYKVHRIIWLMTYGEWPKNEIDHINRIKKDNKIENIRDVTGVQNKLNNGAGGFTVTKYGYVAKIKSNNKSRYLGTYPTSDEAHRVYLDAKEELWQEQNLMG